MKNEEKKIRNIFIILLIFALFITIFTIENSSIITIKFITWKFNISLALIILLCVIVGASITLLLSLKKELYLKKENKKLLDNISVLESKIQEVTSVKK
ncbi:lipopolysaccharide assembly LapA domain-containing protein [Haloimpatiens sp. FM7315]|uniref:LapA family protein n=1 Tax=Haloimpatiens sp. FM7315 TaxID=3298609 RepID=UPI0035A3ADE2